MGGTRGAGLLTEDAHAPSPSSGYAPVLDCTNNDNNNLHLYSTLQRIHTKPYKMIGKNEPRRQKHNEKQTANVGTNAFSAPV